MQGGGGLEKVFFNMNPNLNKFRWEGREGVGCGVKFFLLKNPSLKKNIFLRG